MDFGLMKIEDKKAYLEYWETQAFQECFDLLKKYGMVQNPCPSCTLISIVTIATQLGVANKTLP